MDLGLKINTRTPETILGAILFALMDIHSSLSVINQLVFQAFTTNQFLCLDGDTIFAVLYNGSNSLSDVLEIKSTEGTFDPGEVVIVDLPVTGLAETKHFYRVESIHFSDSKDFGQEFTTGCRCISNTASIYGNLTKNIVDI